jgi:predicted MFS family arabinose efflux permease
VQETKNPAGGRIDWPGLVTFSAALFLLIFALIRGNDEGWGSALISSFLLGSLGLLMCFVGFELRSRNPMLDLTLFRKPAFIGASTAAFVLSSAMFAMFLYITLYLQNQLGYSALATGAIFLPSTLLSFFVAPVSGKLAERFGIRWFIGIGLLLVGAGLLLYGGVDVTDDWESLLPAFIVAGIGIGMVNPALATAAVGVVEAYRSGMASGINNTFRQVGIATGIAAWGAIFQSVVDDKASQFAQLTGDRAPQGGEFSEFITFGAYRGLGADASTAGRQAFLDGFNHITLIAGIVALVGGLVCMAIIRPQDFVEHG